jgi:hypothetical protein
VDYGDLVEIHMPADFDHYRDYGASFEPAPIGKNAPDILVSHSGIDVLVHIADIAFGVQVSRLTRKTFGSCIGNLLFPIFTPNRPAAAENRTSPCMSASTLASFYSIVRIDDRCCRKSLWVETDYRSFVTLARVAAVSASPSFLIAYPAHIRRKKDNATKYRCTHSPLDIFTTQQWLRRPRDRPRRSLQLKLKRNGPDMD